MLSLFSRFLQNLLWIFDFAESLKLPSAHVQLCSECLSGALPALSQCQASGSHNSSAQSICPVVLLLLCCIQFFFKTFSPLTCCWWPCWTSVLICILCCPEISCTGSIWLFPCCMGHSFRGLSLFHSASFWHKACRSHLTNLSSLQIQIIHLSLLLRCQRFQWCLPAQSWLPWGTGHLSGLLFSPSHCFISHSP